MKTHHTTRMNVIACLAMMWAGAAAASQVSIVKVYGYNGEMEEIPMTTEEIQDLRQDIMQEARLHMPALVLAKQQWKASGEKGTFPKSAVDRRRFVKTARFNSKSEAEAYLDRREASREAFQTRKDERKRMSQSHGGSSRCPITGKSYYSKGSSRTASSSKRDKEREQKREASKAERLKRDNRAVDYYLEAMAEVRMKEEERLRKVAEENALVQERLRQLR